MQKFIEKDQIGISELEIGKEYIKNEIKPYKGTTTLAFKVREGIVIAVDSRATSGQYIASQSVQKVIEINQNLLGTMAGGAADCFYWEKLMGVYAKHYELENKKRITAKAASKYLSDCVYQYRGKGLSLGSLISGYNEDGPSIYYVDDEGSWINGDMFSVGSGSTIAYGILESEYSFDLKKEEALDLGKRAIYHATHRDAYSGGVCNLYFMNEEGWKKIGTYDVDELFEEFNSKN